LSEDFSGLVNIENPSELVQYLRGSGLIEPREIPEVRSLTGGVSNRTVLVSRPTGEAWVIKQGLPKLRVEVDWFCSPERVRREAEGLRLLSRITPEGTIPKLIFEDPQHFLFVMEAIPEPHKNWKQMLLAGQLVQSHILQFATLLATIHRGPLDEDLCGTAAFGDLTFFEALRLEPYYAYTSEQLPQTRGFFETLMEETRRLRVALVHGDYSPKNILVYKDRLILLDHEVIHCGDPAFDLGFALTHFLSKAHHLRSRRSAFMKAAADFWEAYLSGVASEKWAEKVATRTVHHTLGCLLARVAGRSPLEYLTDSERRRQKEIVLAMLEHPPEDVGELMSRFNEGLMNCG